MCSGSANVFGLETIALTKHQLQCTLRVKGNLIRKIPGQRINSNSDRGLLCWKINIEPDEMDWTNGQNERRNIVDGSGGTEAKQFQKLYENMAGHSLQMHHL